MSNKISSLIRGNAIKLIKMNQAIKNSFENKKKDPRAESEGLQAGRIFHSSFDQLAFPGVLKEGLLLLKNGDRKTIEVAITFLEEDPYFFRSGYIKEVILRHLSHAKLDESEINQLYDILLDRIEKHRRREFRNYCNLAKKIATDGFIAKLK